MGAPKKPTAMRKLQGTANRNKQRNNPNEPIPTKGIGPHPGHLGKKESEIWDEIVGIMFAGVLCETDRIALEMLVRLVYEFRHKKEVFTGAKYAQMVSLVSRFGMTPSDRTKISIPKAGKVNRFSTVK